MVAYSFKERFEGPIRVGLQHAGPSAQYVGSLLFNPKRQTIRAHRKGRGRHAKPGDEVQLYYAMRTKHCRLIGKARCVAVDRITIWVGHDLIVMLAGKLLGPRQLKKLAVDDGFEDAKDMAGFWLREHGAGKFEGVVIRWEPKT